ncbi:MAG: zinc ABC transporter substrate-binding protein, partial [Candidatus Micrarchaeota archaeon]
SLLPDGTNPHVFEPSPQDIQRAYSAGVFIYNGLALEPYAEQLSRSLPESVVVIEASRGASLIETGEQDHGPYDPHVWLDPNLAKQEIDNIEKGLENADPQNSAYYRDNAEQYKKKLDLLDNEMRSKTSKFRNKRYVGFHPSFTYFNKRYGLEYVAVIEKFAGSEPSAQEMAKIVDEAKANGVHTLFSEPFLDPRAAQAIANEIGGEVVPLNPMHTLTPEERSEGKDYFSIMRDNVDKLSGALS